MKKFFGMLLAAVSALVLLPGCGGGGDNDPGAITVSQFVNGSKAFIIAAGDMNVYIRGNGIAQGSADPDPDSTEAFNIAFRAGVGGDGGEAGRANYSVTYATDDEGNKYIEEATLFLSFENCGNEKLREFFDFPDLAADNNNEVDVEEGADGENSFDAKLTIVFNFKDRSWTNGGRTLKFWTTY